MAAIFRIFFEIPKSSKKKQLQSSGVSRTFGFIWTHPWNETWETEICYNFDA